MKRTQTFIIGTGLFEIDFTADYVDYIHLHLEFINEVVPCHQKQLPPAVRNE